MKFEYQYFGATSVENTATETSVSFAPDTLRAPTYFEGVLRHHAQEHLAFREALSALHAVVVSDARYRGRDKSSYLRWLQSNEGNLLTEFMGCAPAVAENAKVLRAELAEVRSQKSAVLKPFYAAQKRYFDWLYEANRDAWYVLDPVITVHPERLLFEAFSQDESTYCSVSVNHNMFDRTAEMACGTTNIDYSHSLLEEFQKIRSYKTTRFQVDPSGFTATTGDDAAFKQEKIDLPESWVRGFLQVSSAMVLDATVLELHPMDLHNLCATLRQHKERAGPRSLRFELTPNQPAQMVFEPWGIALPALRSQLHGSPLTEPMHIRVWGRRRLLTLERLIPLATRVQVHLLGTGQPSFWVINLGGNITVTLGLSGWTANDWSSAARFNLLQPRHTVSESTKAQVATALQSRWVASAQDIANQTNLTPADVNAALGLWVQAGRAVFDLAQKRYAWRELTREPLSLASLQFASDEEAQALKLVHAGGVKLQPIAPLETGGFVLKGSVKDQSKQHTLQLTLNPDEQLKTGHCTCHFFAQNQMRQGPCAHMLALRQVAAPELVSFSPFAPKHH
jgi:hypothetical protein